MSLNSETDFQKDKLAQWQPSTISDIDKCTATPEELISYVEDQYIFPLFGEIPGGMTEETVIKSLSALMDQSHFGRSRVLHHHHKVYNHLLNIAQHNIDDSIKLTSVLRLIVKLEQCLVNEKRSERLAPGKDGSLSQRVWETLLGIIALCEPPSDSSLLACTALALFLHSLGKPAQAVRLFSSVLTQKSHSDLIKPSISTNTTICLPFISDVRLGEPRVSQFLINGLLTCSKNDVLLEATNEGQPPFILTLFPNVVELCRNKQLSAYHSFTELVNLLKFVQKNLLLIIDKCGIDCPIFSSDSRCVKDLIDLLSLNWNNPVKGIADLIDSAFALILDIHVAERKALKNDEIDHLEDRLLIYVMNESWSFKGKFAILRSLIKYVGVADLLKTYPSFVEDLAESLASNALASSGNEVYRVLQEQFERDSCEDGSQTSYVWWNKVFLRPLVKSLCHKNGVVRYNAMRYWLVTSLKIVPSCRTSIIFELKTMDSTVALLALITTLRLSRSLGILSFDELTENEDFVRRLLNNVEDDIRAEAFALVCQCHKKSSCLSEMEIRLVQYFLPLNLNIDNAAFRQHLVGNFKLLAIRLRDSSLALLKLAKNLNNETALQSAIEFADWLLNLLLRNLAPGGCYQRRQTSLQLLKTLFSIFTENDSGSKKPSAKSRHVVKLHELYKEHNKCALFSPRVHYCLLGCIMDCMEEVKDLALFILEEYYFKHYAKMNGVPSVDIIETELKGWANILCSNPKTMHCESGAVYFKLLFCKLNFEGKLHLLSDFISDLKTQLCAAKNDMLLSSKTGPMHGLVLALTRMICESGRSWFKDCHLKVQSFVRESFQTVTSVIKYVLEILSAKTNTEASAPSFAEMGEAIEDLVSVSSGFPSSAAISVEHQLILACCWLNIKECCLFLGKAVAELPIQSFNGSDYLISHEMIVDVSEVLVLVLTRCRHRGAIESCNLAFEIFCQKLMSSSSAVFHDVIKALLIKSLEEITTQASVTSVTRRSAGLALLVQTVVSSSQQMDLLQLAVCALLDLAKSPLQNKSNDLVDLPQAQALHILRAIVHNAKLSQDILIWIEDIASMCLDAFQSSAWAVRNAALQLFGAVVPRLLGQKRVADDSSGFNSMPYDEFFERWPKLFLRLVAQLEQVNMNSLQSTILPILSLFGRLAPRKGLYDNSRCCLREITLSIKSLLSCPVWHIRQMAAKVMVNLTNPADYSHLFNDLAHDLIGRDSAKVDLNETHGILMVLKLLMRNLTESAHLVSNQLKECTEGLRSCWLFFTTAQHCCPLIKAANLDVICIAPYWLLEMSDIPKSLFRFDTLLNSTWNPGFGLWNRKITSWALNSCEPKDLLVVLESTLASEDPERHESCLTFLTEKLNLVAEGDLFDCRFWSSVQNLLTGFLNMPICDSKNLLTCLDLILSIYTKTRCYPSESGIRTLQEFAKGLSEGIKYKAGASVFAARVAVWAIALRYQLSCDAPFDSSDLKLWSEHIRKHCNPRLSEPFRLLAAEALVICGPSSLNWISSAEENDKNGKILICINEAVLTLLQDEQTDVRREAARFVSCLLSKTENEIDLIHPNLAIKLFGEYTVDRFWKSKAILMYCWEKLRVNGKIEDVFDHWLQKSSCEWTDSSSLFEQENVNVYAERCFMIGFHVNVLKKCLFKWEPSARRSWLNDTKPDAVSKVAQTLISKLSNAKQPSLGCLRLITCTSVAPYIFNICGQLIVLSELDQTHNFKDQLAEITKLIGYDLYIM